MRDDELKNIYINFRCFELHLFKVEGDLDITSYPDYSRVKCIVQRDLTLAKSGTIDRPSGGVGPLIFCFKI